MPASKWIVSGDCYAYIFSNRLLLKHNNLLVENLYSLVSNGTRIGNKYNKVFITMDICSNFIYYHNLSLDKAKASDRV